MQNRVRQVTDSVHGTIYISKLEHLMMSTPFFYRLHDVYQSSTVYMTYPSNRTKRYEHSLGTMELAGQMFYACVTNASVEDQKRFLGAIQELFEKVLEKMEDRSELARVDLYAGQADALNNLIPVSVCNKESFLEILKRTKLEAPLSDRALCKQEVCFFDLLESDDAEPTNTIAIYGFLYQCIQEALRIAALFHDIGHPPFSHIIEFTLKKLYEKENAAYKSHKHQKLHNCLQMYVEHNAMKELLLDVCGYSGEVSDPALHEHIGTHILYNAFRGVLQNRVSEWNKPSRRTEGDTLRAIYLIMVIEFTFGILMEKTPLLSSLHRIIDGPVDVDRLDYIVRDSHNAGVNWGSISYPRLISATRFVYKDNALQLAFPEKVCDDLDDMFTNRFKVFQRINYHHKSIKTSELMQRSVEMLAEDYLLSEDGSEIAPDIHKLWTSLGAGFGQNAIESQISQWTDSWLISVLSQALGKLSDTGMRRRLIDESIGRTAESLDKLYRMLEEVQLNRKRYFPLLKRQRDALHLGKKIVARAGITQKALDHLSVHEYDKLLSQTGDDAGSAREALYRIEQIQNKVLRVADFGLLDTFLHFSESCKELIEHVLEEAQQRGEILDYFLWPNRGFRNLGVDDSTDIFLYRSNGEIYDYNKATSLFPKLRAQREGCLWMYAYVCLPECSEQEAEEKLETLLNIVSNAIGDNIKSVMNELFDFEHRIAEMKPTDDRN